MGKKLSFFYKRTLRHITQVQRNVLFVIDYSTIIKKWNIDIDLLLKNVFEHDKTKLKEPQLSKYIEITWYHYKKHRGEKNLLDKVLSSTATILHITSEPHHPEYWDKEFLIDKDKFNDDRDGIPAKPVNASGMPYESIIEMVCDWYAVTIEKGSELRDWVDFTVNKRWMFLPDQTELIYELVDFFDKEDHNDSKRNIE